LVGVVAGLENLVPKPLDDQGYTDILAPLLWATAIAVESPLKATPWATPLGKVPGSEYLVPKPPAVDHGYAKTYGVLISLTAIDWASGLNAIPLPVVGKVAGLAYFVPNPLPDHAYAAI
jgi:hypothetical protein